MLHSNSKRREKKGKKESRKRTCLLWLPSFYGPTIVSLSSQSKCLSKNVSISQFFPEFSKNMGIEIDVRKKIRDDEEKKRTVPKQKHKSHVCMVGCWLRLYIGGNYFLKERASIATGVRPKDCERKQAKLMIRYLAKLPFICWSRPWTQNCVASVTNRCSVTVVII